jgi:hypothetical protein
MKKRCRWHGPISGKNVRWASSHGRRYKQCRQCYNNYMRDYMRRQR